MNLEKEEKKNNREGKRRKMKKRNEDETGWRKVLVDADERPEGRSVETSWQTKGNEDKGLKGNQDRARQLRQRWHVSLGSRF